MTKRILVIDDEQSIRDSFDLALKKYPYDIDFAENGLIAINKFNNNSYDLIYLDLKMPEMDGIETLREIRKLNSEVPIYIVTAFHKDYFDQLTEAQKDNLAFELLQKPIKMDKIRSITKSILESTITIE